MCQQTLKNNCNTAKTENKLKPTYSIKKVIKMLFKKQQQQESHHEVLKRPQPQPPMAQQMKIADSLDSLESWENLCNAQVEEQFYEEIDDNCVNEKLVNMAEQQKVLDQDIYVPVRFARTTAGTFFWTTNLQPAFITNMPAADEDLVQPAYCYSTAQYPDMQCEDRWGQA